VYLPEDFACCGFPHFLRRYRGVQQTGSYNLQKFAAEPFDVLITAAPPALSTIKKLWPLMAQELSPSAQEQSRNGGQDHGSKPVLV